MKLLLLTQVLPHPPDSGPTIKTWHLLKHLQERDEPADVTLVSFVRGDQSPDVEALRTYCRHIHTVRIRRSPARDAVALIRSMLSGRPWLIARDDRREMAALVRQIAAQNAFDVIHADQLTMCQYAAFVPGTPRLFDAHNATWTLARRIATALPPGARRWVMGREWRRLKDYEGEICRSFDAVTAVTPGDRAALVEAAGIPLPVDVIPCTVDTRAITPADGERGKGLVVHLGTMFWPPNVHAVTWFCQHVWPRVREERPGARFTIAGAKPPRRVRGLAISPGVEVLGYVADPSRLMAEADVFVVPLQTGSGMRVKILTAMAYGVPVVSTTIGCEGIEAVPGQHILVADTPDEFAAAVLRLMTDRDLSREIALNARALVERRYDYRVALTPLDAVYTRLATGSRPSA